MTGKSIMIMINMGRRDWIVPVWQSSDKIIVSDKRSLFSTAGCFHKDDFNTFRLILRAQKKHTFLAAVHSLAHSSLSYCESNPGKPQGTWKENVIG